MKNYTRNLLPLLSVLFLFSCVPVKEELKFKAVDEGPGVEIDTAKDAVPFGEIVSFDVKEAAAVGVDNYPISKVIPLKKDLYYNTDSFYLEDAKGNMVDAQFEVIEKWWAKGKSLRHINVHFLSTVEPFNNDSTTGIRSYKLMSGEPNNEFTNPIKTIQSNDSIELSNGLINIDIQKSPLKIITPGGELKSIFTKEDGSIDESFSHNDIEFKIEEDGPVRSVVKISSKTFYNSPTDIKHGWALRIYAYADTKFIKIDFQLQNSAINTALSAPLYFQGHKLVLNTGVTGAAKQLRAETPVTADVLALPIGAIESNKVNVVLKDFYQRFPNGLSLSLSGDLSVELNPEWKREFHDRAYADADIYWLDDMRHSYKEILIDFDTTRDTASLKKLAKTFQFPPVGVIKAKYYDDTKVTLDMGGHIPSSSFTPKKETSRLPTYSTYEYNITHTYYAFGADSFGLDVNRKRATNMTGGTPYRSNSFYVSGNPSNYYKSQDLAKAELNIRPQWLSGYKHDIHQTLIEPTANPYGGSSWRRFKGHYIPTSTRGYITGTSRTAHPRDDQHGWFYHMEDAYFQSGNLWMKDWYKFVAEFRKTFLLTLDPWPDNSHRAIGHSLAHTLAAYRVTGQTEILDLAMLHYKNYMKPKRIGPYGITGSNETSKAACFQLGFLLKPYITLYLENDDKEILSFIKDNVGWINDISNYAYYIPILGPPATKGGGTGISAVDPVAWYISETGDMEHYTKLTNFVTIGIGGGKPYGNFQTWKGQFEGRSYRNLVEK